MAGYQFKGGAAGIDNTPPFDASNATVIFAVTGWHSATPEPTDNYGNKYSFLGIEDPAIATTVWACFSPTAVGPGMVVSAPSTNGTIAAICFTGGSNAIHRLVKGGSAANVTEIEPSAPMTPTATETLAISTWVHHGSITNGTIDSDFTIGAINYGTAGGNYGAAVAYRIGPPAVPLSPKWEWTTAGPSSTIFLLFGDPGPAPETVVLRSPVIRNAPPIPRRFDWVRGSPYVLLFPPATPTPFALHDWPNPRLRVPQRADWIRGTPETLTRPPGLNPAALHDWPNPRGYPFPIENRTFLQGVNLPANPPPAAVLPFSLKDWPNPLPTREPLPRGAVWPTDILQDIPPPPPPIPDAPSTGGRLKRDYDEWKRRQERDEPDRRGDEQADRGDEARSPDLAEYTDKAKKLTEGIARLRAERRAIEQESRELEAQIVEAEKAKRTRAAEKARAELLRKEQAEQLAAAQEQALMAELELLDIAYVAVIAIGVLIQ